MISGTFFAKCVQVERKLAKIYAHFSAIERYPQRRRDLWLKLSQDEEGHALELELASRLAIKDEKLTAAISINDIDELLQSLVAIYEKIVLEPLSDAEAVKLAVEIEVQTAMVHSRSALVFSDGKLHQLFKVLGTYDAKHLTGLIAAFEELFSCEPVVLTSLLES